MDRLDMLAEPLRHKITIQVTNEMDSSLKQIKSLSISHSKSNHEHRIRTSSSFDPDDSLTRASAEEMDEQRQQHIAYSYLCHLEEAKKWIETCIREELPGTTECEENLRNGVYLAKLANFFCPEKVPFKRIYDKDQSKYQLLGLQFRHTDNINHWFNAMEHIGLPRIFFPETTDVYDKKNMPRVIYCLHALSLYLFKLGIASQIQDLYGVAKFTEEEISTMARELLKYGLQIPEFTKIGGILAEEMPVDEAALHAAVLAINDAVEKKDLEALLAGLLLHDAHLTGVVSDYICFYHELMLDTKLNKSEASQNRDEVTLDVYDELLTQTEIQAILNKINDYADSVINLLVDKLSNEISECISRQDMGLLLQLLKSKCSPFKNVIDKNADWYLAQLTQEKESKLSENLSLNKSTIQHSIDVANSNAEKYLTCVKLLDDLNACLINNRRDEFAILLSQHATILQIDEIDADYAGSLYFVEFKFIYDEKDAPLDIDDLVHGVRVLNSVVDINKVLDTASPDSIVDSFGLLTHLGHKNAHLSHLVDPELKLNYLRSLIASKNYKNNSTCSSSTSLGSDSRNNLSLSDSGHADSEILQCALLTHSDIQECLVTVNQDHKREIEIIELLNGKALTCQESFNQVVGLFRGARPDKLNIIELNISLYQAELRKVKVSKNLSPEDLNLVVGKANTVLENALNMTKTMLLLNQVDVNRHDQVLRLLSDKSLGLNMDSNIPSDVYYKTLTDLRRICQKPLSVCSITNNSISEYFWNKTLEDYDFYLNMKSPSVYSWKTPVNFTEASHLITRTILKKALDQATQSYTDNLAKEKQELLVTKLQALVRGCLYRKRLNERANYLKRHVVEVIRIQAWWRMVRTKRMYDSRVKHQRSNLKAIVTIQAAIRMWIARRDFLKRREIFVKSVSQIVKIQACVRGRNARQDYRALVGDKSPGLKVLRKFVHLLEANSADLAAELELQELKRQVMQAIKTNKNLEHDLDMMDVKIGLLIKNRITLQDVLVQHKRLRKYKEDIENGQSAQVKSLSKENHEKMELYQNLFYLLQTRPAYLAQLLFQLSPTNSTRFIETVVLQLFNYGANSREEHLLLKLFTASLELEIESKVDKISDIITGTPLVIKVIVSLYRKHRGENVLRNLLNPLIEQFLSDTSTSLCLNPCDIYKAWISRLETESGKPSGLPYETTSKRALEHAPVRQQFEANLQAVKAHTTSFLHLILRSIDKLPFGLRYLAKVLRNKLRAKFPQASEREVLKVVGNLVYYRFINSALCSPDAYDVVDTKAGVPLSTEQRRNLACISKHLNLIAMSKGYGDTENAHLACLNPFIKESHELMRSYFQEVCNVPEADEHFGVGEYSDLLVLAKPVVYMTVQEIGETHRLLVEHLERIAPASDDPLRQIFRLLRHEPDLESFTARPVSMVSLSGRTESLERPSFSKNTQLCLTLTNRFPPRADETTDLADLIVKTKRLILEVIHCQGGESLKQIMKVPASVEQEKYHQHLVQKRQKNVKMLTPEYQKIVNSLSTNLEVIKKEVNKCISELIVGMNLKSADEVYEEVLSRIAQDIRNQRKHRQRRQKELMHLLEVHRVLSKKSELLKEQVGYYNEYVKACLDSLNHKRQGSRSGIRNPFKRGQREKLQGSVKYTAAKLYEKGVIVEMVGVQTKQFKSVVFEINTTDEPGVFEVEAKILGKTIEKFDLVFQDLLQLQYEGLSIASLSDLKVNVNLLIFLLNKKFYGK